jgi:hypothetical protein
MNSKPKTVSGSLDKKRPEEDASFCIVKDGTFHLLLCLTDPAQALNAKKTILKLLKLQYLKKITLSNSFSSKSSILLLFIKISVEL